jgi:hypothetical protein
MTMVADLTFFIFIIYILLYVNINKIMKIKIKCIENVGMSNVKFRYIYI